MDKKSEFAEKTKDFLMLADTIQLKEQDTLTEINDSDVDSAIIRLHLAEEMLNLTTVHLDINDISMSIFKKKDENAMNNARKSLNKCLNYLESVVTKSIDSPFSVYEQQLEEIAAFTPAERYALIQKMGTIMNLFKEAIGSDPKWKGTMVEFDGRYAIVAKNILNLRDVVANTDPRSPNYEPTLYHVRLVKKLLLDAADRYRHKYEVVSQGIDDFKMAILFLRALAMFDLFTGDQADAEVQKKKLAVWKNKLNMDIKTRQQSQKG
jgi:hypothetical protein